MYRIHIFELNYNVKKIPLLLDFEESDWQLVEDRSSANLIFCNEIEQYDIIYQECPNAEILLLHDLYHAREDGWAKIITKLAEVCAMWSPKQVVFLTSYKKGFDCYIDNQPSNLKIVPYDIMFNRTKAYYAKFPFSASIKNEEMPWYWSKCNNYQIAAWPRSAESRSKIFLHASRTHNNRQNNNIRQNISKFLAQYKTIGYHSATPVADGEFSNTAAASRWQGLASYEDDPLNNGNLVFDIESGEVRPGQEQLDRKLAMLIQPRGYSPPHLNYYEDSFISIYAETIEHGASTFISEKTLDPLIHGHLILPFSNQGFIQTLKEQGFKLPNWIDYSYDDEPHWFSRFLKYIKEVDRLLSFDKTWWVEKFEASQDIRIHNQQLFWRRDYCQFLNKI